MRKTNSTIEINGHRYDAATGRPLTAGSTPLQPAPAHPAAAQPRPARQHTAERRVVPQPAHPAAPSHTLMRQTVKKPVPGPKKPRLKAYGPTAAIAKQPLAAVAAKPSVQRLDEQRLRHAEHVARSQLISHFSAAGPAAFVPVNPPAPGRAAMPVVAAPPVVQQKQPPTKDELLQHALKHARSHEELPPRRPRRHASKRKLGAAAAAALSILLIGVVALHNVSGARFRVAAARAGISASLPGYLPAGYSLGQLHYSSGVVSAQFRSGSEHYTVVQQRSDWNDATLLSNFVAPRDPNYQTASGAGRVIYLYNGTNATWVSGNTWYVIQSDGSLSQQQLLNLAASL